METEKTNMKYILKVYLKVVGKWAVKDKLRMTPRFLTLEIGRMVVPFTEMAKTGCEKADSCRWDMEAKQEFLLGHPKRCKGSCQM